MRSPERVHAFDPAGSAAALDLLRTAREGLAKLTDASLEVDYLKQQLDATEKQASTKSAKAAIAKVRQTLEPLVKGEGDTGPALEPISEALRALYNDVEGSDTAPTEPQRAVLAAIDERLERALTLWQDVKASSLAALNTTLSGAGTPQIVIPPVDQIHPSPVSPGVERP